MAQQVSEVVTLHQTEPSSFPTMQRSSVTLITKPEPITIFTQEVVKLTREKRQPSTSAGF